MLRQLDVLTVNISPACMQLSGKEKQLVQKTLNDLSFGLPVIVETTGTTDEARNLAATTIQAHLRGHWTRRLTRHHDAARWRCEGPRSEAEASQLVAAVQTAIEALES